jgi:uncharacterized protein
MSGGGGRFRVAFAATLRPWAISMFGKIRFSRWLIAAAVLAVAECAGVAAVEFAFTAPAQAQFFGDQQYRRAPPRSGGFLQNFFGPFNSRPYEGEYGPPQQKQKQPRQHTQQPSESSHAPAPRKTESKGEQVAPTTSIVVMGDGMADWLAYGLEDAFSDSPEIGVVRENKLYSGLLHYDPKGDLDWWHVARDILAQKKANYVVMMLGLSDRESIREKDLAKEAEKKEAEKKEAEKKKVKDQQDKSNADKSGQNKDDSAQKKDSVPDKEAGDPDQPSIVVPEPQPGKRANGIIEFRTEQWAAIYSRRIDATIAALKSKGVPVFWVGLPSIRGTRSTADAVYLNDLYRARAERAGAIYIDVWDGFVDEAGKYSNFGPDYEGQMRRLRLSDGVYFTKYGARKLAHYVERELRRHINNRALQVSLPSGPVAPVPVDGKSVARPLAGPVVPLTGTSGNSEELLVGAGGGSAHGDAIATKVLVKGEPVAAPPGRADDFAWPRGGDANAAQPVAAAPPAAAQAKGVPPAAAGASASVPAEPLAPAEKNKEEPRSGSAEKTTQKTVAKPKRPEETRPRSPRDNVLRPPRPIGPSGGPFGWVR